MPNSACMANESGIDQPQQSQHSCCFQLRHGHSRRTFVHHHHRTSRGTPETSPQLSAFTASLAK